MATVWQPQIKTILDEGSIEVGAPGASERRPLHRAAGGNHKEICKYLIEKGALVDQTDKSGRTALHWAAISGHREAAEFLLSIGADVIAITTSKMTPLHGACEGGRLEIVRLLLEKAGDKKDAACNALDDDGKTPCALAIGGKHKAIIKLLKELGDPNAASVACVVS